MDEGREQREQQGQQSQQHEAQRDDAAAFSLKLGGDQPQPGEAPPASQPSQPLRPSYPSQPSQPLYPSQPSHPLAGAPPPLTPTPATPSQPLAPQFAPYPLATWSTATPSQPQAAGVMQSPPPTPPPAPRKRGPLGRPFPLPLSALIVLGCAALLAGAFGARVMILHGDWSEGAAAVGIVALALAIIVALGALLRVAAGRRTIGFGLLTIALLVALTGAGVAGLAGNDSLHGVQAQTLEKNGQWSLAIHEYQLAGQKAPNAPDIARVYDAWGEQALKQGDFQGALTHFQTVLDDYDESGAAVPRAEKGQFNTYVAWLRKDPDHLPYHEAIVVFTNYMGNAGCDSACQATLAEVAPQAHFLYGEQLLLQKQYAGAITEFGKVTSQYKSSPYAKQAHTRAAQAYYAYGQQQISNQNCGDAVTLYQTLTKDYKDTPEASKAQTALDAPQDVTGYIKNAPTNPSPTAHLSKRMNFNAFFFSDEYATSLDPKSGQFTFKRVAQGTYYLSTSRPVAGGIDYVAWWADSAHTSYFSFVVGPLCTVDLGTFDD